MKVHSIAPFEFRGGIKLPKGDSDFDVESLNKDGRAFFDGLVKAAVVTILPEQPAEPVAPDAPPAPEAPAPPAEDTKPKLKKG